ncbi:hypothetical protein [Psychroserpens sp. NJDZ02]|uniref:hypothetical protein n=1 Tax=Psychroserpens sp. NJDZ02 TaxID=2570561 RepID=UPI0010A8FAAA|nr:hypothetical protein [Psychroserpens sp. NJDZ02]QCE42140.1 hypothetical protein E9099_12260 [Psychroserpens sp. NJDZ02]
MRTFILFFIIALSYSCKTKINPPSIKVIEIPDPNPHTSKVPLGNNSIKAVVKYFNGKNVTLAAIKLVVNDTTCVNSYSNFDGQFSILYDKEIINTESHLVVVFKGYSKKIIPFTDIEKDSVITLNKSGELLTETEYHYFFDNIRSCTQ